MDRASPMQSRCPTPNPDAGRDMRLPQGQTRCLSPTLPLSGILTQRKVRFTEKQLSLLHVLNIFLLISLGQNLSCTHMKSNKWRAHSFGSLLNGSGYLSL